MRSIDEVPDANPLPLRESLCFVVLGDQVGCMVDEKYMCDCLYGCTIFGLWSVAVYCRFTS